MGIETLTSERFMEVYISEALKLLPSDSRSEVDLEGYNSEVRERVSKVTGLSDERVLGLHHAFHWMLFNDEGHPYALVRTPLGNGPLRIRRVNFADCDSLVENFSKKYGGYFSKRFSRLVAA